MKKMFVTGMNMNETKAYVEPKMKVIEVDMQSLCDVNSPNYNGGGSTSGEGGQGGFDPNENPFGAKSFSVWDTLWD